MLKNVDIIISTHRNATFTKWIYTSLTDQLPGDVSLLLTNAIWFKDSWNQPFDPVFERWVLYLSIINDTSNKHRIPTESNFSIFAFLVIVGHSICQMEVRLKQKWWKEPRMSLLCPSHSNSRSWQMIWSTRQYRSHTRYIYRLLTVL